MQVVCKHQEQGVQSKVEQIQIILCILYETLHKYFFVYLYSIMHEV